MHAFAFARAVLALAALVGAGACAAQSMPSGEQLAADRGCYNCHGEPPRRNVPSFKDIAAGYARYRGRLDAAAELQLVERLRGGSLFSHIAAHERLGDEDARVLIRWLVEGR